MITKANIEELMLLSVDGELDAKAEKELQLYLMQHADAKLQYEEFKQVVLVPMPEEKLATKMNLYAIANENSIVATPKKKNRIIFWAAASIAMLIGAFTIWNNQNISSPALVENTSSTIAPTTIPTTKTPTITTTKAEVVSEKNQNTEAVVATNSIKKTNRIPSAETIKKQSTNNENSIHPNKEINIENSIATTEDIELESIPQSTTILPIAIEKSNVTSILLPSASAIKATIPSLIVANTQVKTKPKKEFEIRFEEEANALENPTYAFLKKASQQIKKLVADAKDIKENGIEIQFN
jgi:hypothetical protein